MNSRTTSTTAAECPHALLWTAVLLFGTVFFYKGHDFSVSLHDEWAPWVSSDDSVTRGGNVLKGAALSLIALFGLLAFLLPRGRRFRFNPLTLLTILYPLWCGLSLAWSEDPAATLRYLAVLVFCLIAAMGIARQFSSDDLLRFACWITGLFVVVGWLTELALGTFRPWADGYRFAGTVHPNTQGVYLAILCLGLACRLGLGRFARTDAVLFGAGLMLLLLTKSRTCAAGLLFAATVICLTRQRGLVRILTMSAVCWIAGLMLLAVQFVHPAHLGSRTQELILLGRQEESVALTGRLPIWQELMHYVAARPWTGYGYGAFWSEDRIEEISEQLHWIFREAHSGYLDSMLAVGLVGTLLLISIALWATVGAVVRLRRSARPGDAFALGLLAFAAVNVTTESGLLIPDFPFLLIGCSVLQLSWCDPERQPRSAVVPTKFPHGSRRGLQSAALSG